MNQYEIKIETFYKSGQSFVEHFPVKQSVDSLLNKVWNRAEREESNVVSILGSVQHNGVSIPVIALSVVR